MCKKSVKLDVIFYANSEVIEGVGHIKVIKGKSHFKAKKPLRKLERHGKEWRWRR